MADLLRSSPAPSLANDPALDEPLSLEENVDLLDLLTCDAMPEHCMSLSALDGYLTGLVCGQAVPPLEHWLKWVWDPEHGRAEPQFARASDAQRLVELIVRHANSTAQLLDEEPELFEPMFDEPGEADGGATIVDGWCLGFLVAVGLDKKPWEPLFAGHPEWFHELFLYGTEQGWHALERLDPDQMDGEAHEQRIALIAPAVRQIFAWWSSQRPRPRLSAPPPVHTAHTKKVGRNEPCPCGSGRKFKHCHASGGAPGA
jgi:uncharacterized protein